MTFKMFKGATIRAAIAAAMISLTAPALAQGGGAGLPVVPLGFCVLSAAQLAASIGLASCTRASFTGTGDGTALTVTSVTGVIKVGDVVAGTGVTAGTTIAAQASGTTGGAGVYTTSAATTSSSASLTSGGIPPGATMVYLVVDTAGVRWRDDGAAPTASVGVPIASAGVLTYTSTLSAIRFILQTGSPVINLAFYRSP